MAVVAGERPETVPRDALIFKTKAGPAVVLATPGNKALKLCGELPGDLAEALRSCVVNTLGLARSVSLAERSDGAVVEYGGVAAPDLYGKFLVKSVLGSVLASITAAVAAELWRRPVEIADERAEGRRLVVVLR